MLRAVLFDWGHTLMDWVWDDDLVARGHRAGLEALGRDDLPDVELLSDAFRERYLPLLHAPGTIEEVEYPGLVRQLLGEFSIEVTDEELNRYLEAEHVVWEPASRVASTSVALLESLRDRGLKTGLVSNAVDPPWLLHRDLERQGLAHLLDVVVFSSEIGKRKPHPAIFEAALDALGVAPEETLFVGDRLYEDVRGAADLGMRTVHALWFRAEELTRDAQQAYDVLTRSDGREPDFQAFTQMDVLAAVRRLTTP